MNFRERSIYEVENLETDSLKTMHTPQKVFIYPQGYIYSRVKIAGLVNSGTEIKRKYSREKTGSQSVALSLGQ